MWLLIGKCPLFSSFKTKHLASVKKESRLHSGDSCVWGFYSAVLRAVGVRASGHRNCRPGVLNRDGSLEGEGLAGQVLEEA